MSAITIFDRRDRPGSLWVKDFQPTLTERGKIKIGRKGEKRRKKGSSGNNDEDFYQLPTKLDHFVVTTLNKDDTGNFARDEAIHKHLGDKPTRIPVRLIFNDPDLDFQTRYVAFNGKTIWCQGDGETATREGKQRPCPCPNRERGYRQTKDSPACKINGRLQVMIDGASGVGGVHVLRTTSWNTANGIMSSLLLLQGLTGGRLAGIPFALTLSPKQVADPDGRMQTVYIVGIEYPGSVADLRDIAYKAALADAQQGERYKMVEQEARRLLAAPIVSEDEQSDIADEFYPEEAAADDDLVIRDRPEPAVNAAPDDGVVYVFDAGGVEHALTAEMVNEWSAHRIADASDVDLRVLAENNKDEPSVAAAFQEEIDRREAARPQAESIIVHFPNNNGGKDMEYRDLAEAGQRLTAYAENAIARKAFANVRAVIAANEQLMERAPAIRNVLMALLGDEATGPRDEGVKVADGQEAML